LLDCRLRRNKRVVAMTQFAQQWLHDDTAGSACATQPMGAY
jgi:hypothetical protein